MTCEKIFLNNEIHWMKDQHDLLPKNSIECPNQPYHMLCPICNAHKLRAIHFCLKFMLASYLFMFASLCKIISRLDCAIATWHIDHDVVLNVLLKCEKGYLRWAIHARHEYSFERCFYFLSFTTKPIHLLRQDWLIRRAEVIHFHHKLCQSCDNIIIFFREKDRKWCDSPRMGWTWVDISKQVLFKVHKHLENHHVLESICVLRNSVVHSESE